MESSVKAGDFFCLYKVLFRWFEYFFNFFSLEEKKQKNRTQIFLLK